MRVLAEEGVLLALGTVLAVMTGIRTDAVFIAGLLLAVSVTGLVEWLHADERWPWLPCVAYLIVAAAVPAWCLSPTIWRVWLPQGALRGW